MPQLEHIDAIERRLWSAADTLRANSKYAGNEYFLPVMGLVFLRHAYSRYLAVRDEIEAGLPTRGGRKRAVTREDFSQKNALFLRPEARFDHLVALPDGADRAAAVVAAMESIEADYGGLRGVLPKSEYQALDNEVLGELLRKLNPDELKRVSGDVFGRIYEYFLTKFADQKAHDDGEFFTPVSLVSLIAHVLDPDRGTVLDPACGSGGMFVQSARTVEEHGGSPTERLTFRGVEKNETTIRLARMNLAVHGLEGDIRQAITYYDDPHELLGRADYVMANPPFNVDEIDADKVRSDPRLPFGLPGVNRKRKVGNGNYVWISYFHSYLNETGRAGFVMSSQASSAGGAEAEVRRRLVETGDVEVMIAVRANFFYTRTVPCELWFLNRAQPEARRGKVLMIDARPVYRKVTRKIYDFSPEQQQNLLAVVWLHRGQAGRFVELVNRYLGDAADAALACFEQPAGGDAARPLPAFVEAIDALDDVLRPFLEGQPATGPHAEPQARFRDAAAAFAADAERFLSLAGDVAEPAADAPSSTDENIAPTDARRRSSAPAPSRRPSTAKNVASTDPGRDTVEPESTAVRAGALAAQVERFAPLAERSRDLAQQADQLHRLAVRLIETCERECDARSSDAWNTRVVARARRTADDARREAVEALERVRYLWRQARWLTDRFPDAALRDVPGLVKLVDRAEIEANDWSLTPGRYVGVAPEEEDENFDFKAALREIHAELETLDAEAVTLAARIRKNFEELGI